MPNDRFRPRKEPARMIYDALLAEAEKRTGRSTAVWLAAERNAVWSAARDYAQQHDLHVLTLDEIERAERLASGHVDYAVKWAYGVAGLLQIPSQVQG